MRQRLFHDFFREKRDKKTIFPGYEKESTGQTFYVTAYVVTDSLGLASGPVEVNSGCGKPPGGYGNPKKPHGPGGSSKPGEL
ncbi:MAG: hypothetical protein NT166_29095 [Candidatus Aminicenantes bacterium]|nr:hypothetical protein [Candidatus Aminicenantes bacterium]